MGGLIVILLYAFKLAFLASLACVRTKEFSLKSKVKKAYLHAHKRIIIMPAIMKEVYSKSIVLLSHCTVEFRKQQSPLLSDLAGQRDRYHRAAITFGWLKNVCNLLKGHPVYTRY